MRYLRIGVASCFAIIGCSCGQLPAEELEWHPDANMDAQLFPSLLIATAARRPVEQEEQPDPELLGDPYGSVGIAIKPTASHTNVKVTVLENSVMNKSSWSGELEKAGGDYYVAPKIDYKFDQLRKNAQQVPLNVTFELEVNGKTVGEKSETLKLRTINDCPFAVADAEETIDPSKDQHVDEDPEGGTADEDNSVTGFADMGWMFAAYVNENSPTVDKILKEAVGTKIVDHFAGYQDKETDVLRELFAIWAALQSRGTRYGNIATPAGGSEIVFTQQVRFVDESVTNEQANCADGSVLLCSVLRKIGLKSFLVKVPNHMYMGVYLRPNGEHPVALDTTLIGSSVNEEAYGKVMKQLNGLLDELDKEMSGNQAWKSFANAVAVGTENLNTNEQKFQGDDPQYQITDIDDARADGIMPISYQKVK